MKDTVLAARPWRADGYGEKWHVGASMHRRLEAQALSIGACQTLGTRPHEAVVLITAAMARPSLDRLFTGIDTVIGASPSKPQQSGNPTPPWGSLWAPAAVPAYAIMQGVSLVGVAVKTLLLLGASVLALAALAVSMWRRGPGATMLQVQQRAATVLSQTSIAKLGLPDVDLHVGQLVAAWAHLDEPGAHGEGFGPLAEWALQALPNVLGHLDVTQAPQQLSASLTAAMAYLSNNPDLLGSLDAALTYLQVEKSAAQLIGLAQTVMVPLGQQVPWDRLAQALANPDMLAQALKAFEEVVKAADLQSMVRLLDTVAATDLDQLVSSLSEVFKKAGNLSEQGGLKNLFRALEDSFGQLNLKLLAHEDGTPTALAQALDICQERFNRAVAGQSAQLTEKLISALESFSQSDAADRLNHAAEQLSRLFSSENLEADTSHAIPHGCDADVDSNGQTLAQTTQNLTPKSGIVTPSALEHLSQAAGVDAWMSALAQGTTALMGLGKGATKASQTSRSSRPPTAAADRSSAEASYDRWERENLQRLRDEAADSGFIEARDHLAPYKSDIRGSKYTSKAKLLSVTSSKADYHAAVDKLKYLLRAPQPFRDDPYATVIHRETARLRRQIALSSPVIQEGDVHVVRSVSAALAARLGEPPRTHRVSGQLKGRLNARRAMQAVMNQQAGGAQKRHIFDALEDQPNYEAPAVAFLAFLPHLKIREYRSAARAAVALVEGTRGHRPEHIRLGTLASSIVGQINLTTHGTSFSDWRELKNLPHGLYEAAQSTSDSDAALARAVDQFGMKLKNASVDHTTGMFSFDHSMHRGLEELDAAEKKLVALPRIIVVALTAELAPIFTEQARKLEEKTPKHRFCGLVMGGQEAIFDDPDHRLARAQDPADLADAMLTLIDGACAHLSA